MTLPEPMPRAARGAIAAFCGLALLLAACGNTAPSTTATPPASAAPTGSAGPLPHVDLPGEISADAYRQHLVELEGIAQENDGVRTIGTPGYAASVEYVITQLQSFGLHVVTPTFRMPTFRELPGSTIRVQGGGPAFAAPHDFHAMIFSASGDVTARVATVGFSDSAGGEGNQGCDATDWVAFPAGAIALTPPGACFRRDEAILAQDAGAVAIVVAYPHWEAGEARRPTLIQPAQIRIPVISAIGAVGDALTEAADSGTRVRVSVQTEIDEATVRNVIAESPGSGSGDRVVMVGAHLDSVHDGPGINDNGSGTAAVLEIARLLGGSEHPATFRFALWAGEELGLYGSGNYVQGLNSLERRPIAAYLNLDMLGSPNGVPIVYRDAAAAPGSEAIGDFLAGWLEANGDGAEFEDLGGGSDHYFFEQIGIPTAGIFSGATEEKTSAQAAAYGGQAGEPMDACYHLSCDTADRVDVERAVLYATDAASVMLLIARGEILPES